jgi:hypothetical protein
MVLRNLWTPPYRFKLLPNLNFYEAFLKLQIMDCGSKNLKFLHFKNLQIN